jgi:hypothetical protein
MDRNDRDVIEGLFDRIARVERRSGPRDRGAEALINAKIGQQPAAPYYMAQTILMQEKALNDAQERIEELEGRRSGSPRGRGLAAGPWGAPAWSAGGGGGFLAGAAQTAMGVAGGVLLGNMLADWLMPDAGGEQTVQSDADSSADQSDGGNFDVADAGGFGDLDIGDF